MSFFEFFFGKKAESKILEINHPKLGHMIYEEEGWWKGETDKEGFKIEFFVDGDETGVNEILATDCFHVLANFFDFKTKAMNLLKKQVTDWKIKQELEFTPTDLWNFFRKGERSSFAMSFSEKTKPDFHWFVEFENSEAKHAGFDS